MDPEELRDYCIDYLRETPASRAMLLEIFCLILRTQGKSYQRCRSAWIRHHGSQMELFDEYRMEARRMVAADRIKSYCR